MHIIYLFTYPALLEIILNNRLTLIKYPGFYPNPGMEGTLGCLLRKSPKSYNHVLVLWLNNLGDFY